MAGIAVNVLGHGHPDLVLAIKKQAQHLIHTSNLYYTEPQSTSGADAGGTFVRAKRSFSATVARKRRSAIKLARKYSYDKYGADR